MRMIDSIGKIFKLQNASGKITFGGIYIAILTYVIYALSAFSLAAYHEKFSATTAIDVLVLIAPIILIAYIRIKIEFASVFLALSTVSFMMSLMSLHFLDALLAYKWLAYVGVLYLVCKANIMPINVYRNICKVLIATFLIKYSLQKFGLSINRPASFNENNWELLMVVSLSYVSVMIGGRKLENVIIWIALCAICLLSGSKSGIACYLSATILIVTSMIKQRLIVSKIFAVSFMLIIIMVSSMYDFEVDRLSFFRVFLDEMASRPGYSWFVGYGYPQPLTWNGCSKLFYYQLLFSASGDGNCYSVIYHLGLLRSIFDFGVLGWAATSYSIFKILKKSGCDAYLSFSMVFLAFVNSLSVAGFYGQYAAISLLMTCILIKSKNPNTKV